MKINRFEAENVKRIRAVQVEPTPNGLTVIGGKNAQGKTSVLDAIAWALGGNKHKPTEAVRDGSVIPPYLKVVMDNGLIVERKGKNSELKVTDPSGMKAGQKLLDSFVEELALDLPKFMEASGQEKAKILLRIIGVEDQLAELEEKEKQLYSERRYIGQIADSKEKYAEELPEYPDAPEEPVSPSELIREQQEILARNGQREQWKREYSSILNDLNILDQKIEDYEQVLRQAREKRAELQKKAVAAEKSPRELEMESTEELEESIRNVDEINRRVRANADRRKAEEEAKGYKEQYQALTAELEKTRRSKTDLLNSAELPLPELSVSEGELIYKGHKWDCMSSAEQLRVATAIVRKLNPQCGFVLLDKLEMMDLDTLQEFGAWLEAEGLQAIATRVSTGDECSVIIEDGCVAGKETKAFVPKSWEGGF